MGAISSVLVGVAVRMQQEKGARMPEIADIHSPEGRNRLRWRSRRGMAELDVLFIPFFEEAFPNLDESMQLVYARMLDEEDPELWAWFSEQTLPQDPEYQALVALMLARVRPD